jgi:hypothetical protein
VVSNWWLLQAIKRLGKTDGVPAFNALFTMINQYSEIRSMNFTPSKAQDGWAPILTAMLPSLANFGHSPPKIVFMDNIRADKDKLLSIFPSLSAGVIPVQPASTQEPLVLPEDWSSIPLTTTFQVNHRFNIIMNQHTPTTPVVVAFSVQWPIDATTGKTGRVALIQVAYQKVVYLIQVSPNSLCTNCSLMITYHTDQIVHAGWLHQSPTLSPHIFPV